MASHQPALSLNDYVQSFTKLSKVLAGTLLGGFLLQLVAPSCRQYLALIPGRTLPFVYTVVTSGLLEDSFLGALAYAVGTLFLLRIVEPAQGTRAVLRFLLSVLAATGASTFLFAFLLYISNQDKAKAGAYLYTEICGFQGGFAALLVAVKQLIPENEVALFGGLLTFRAKHLPGLYVLLILGIGALAGQTLKLAPFALFGAYYAWGYLRFVQLKDDGTRGDLSDDFRLASFFPEAAQPLVDQVCAPFAGLAPRGGGGAGGAAQPGRGHALGGAAEPAPDSWDAARKRERGARALEERLGLVSAATAAPAEPAGGDDIEAAANRPGSQE